MSTAKLFAVSLLCVGLLQTSSISGETDRCTFQFLNSHTIEAACEGTHEIRKHFRLSKSKKPIDVMPGVQLLADPIIPGERALIAISNRSIELHNLQFRSTYVMERLGIAAPLAIVGAEVVVRNSMFSVCGKSAVVGGMHMSGSNVSVVDSSFFTCGTAKNRIPTGAILGDQSLVDVSRSEFFDLESIEGAVLARQASTVSIKDSSFTQTNGVQGAAVSAMSGGKVTLERTRIEMCTSTEHSAVTMLGVRQLTIDSCTLMSNRGLHGGAVAFSGSSYARTSEYRRRSKTFTIRDTYIGGNVADTSGGGLYVENANLIMENSEVILNRAGDHGAGLFISNTKTTAIKASKFVENRSRRLSFWGGQNGGGIYASGIKKFSVIRTEILRNKALAEGGGVSFVDVERLDVHRTAIEGNFAKSGAGVAVEDSRFVTVAHSNITKNKAERVGGGLLSSSIQRLYMKGTRFSSNAADFDSAARLIHARSLRVQDCVFRSNSGGEQSSGLFIGDTTKATISGSHFRENTLLLRGAALRAVSVLALKVDKSIFLKNSAADGAACGAQNVDDMPSSRVSFVNHKELQGLGASLSLEKVANAIVSDTKFGMNLAKVSGGAIFGLSVGSLTCIGTTFFENRAESAAGGSISLQDTSMVTITDSHFRNNSALNEGGAIFMDNVQNLHISGSIFKSNKATGLTSSHGGALAVFIFSSLTMHGCNFFHNIAGISGGAVSLPNAPNSMERQISIKHSHFSDNGAKKGSGGALFIEQARVLEISDSPFESNTAHQKGSAFFSTATNRVKILGSQFSGNDAEIEDGDDDEGQNNNRAFRTCTAAAT